MAAVHHPCWCAAEARGSLHRLRITPHGWLDGCSDVRGDAREGEAVLSVCHSTARGTKRAIGEAIYEAGASNLSSVHQDFNHLGFAYDLARLDKPLSQEKIDLLIERAAQLTGDQHAIRSIRQMII